MSAESTPKTWPTGVEIKKYTGGCHCKKFRYEFEHPLLEETQVVTCNCSICTQKGGLLVYTPEKRFTFTEGSFDELTPYQFNRKIVTHYFCPVCGCNIIGKGMSLVAVNLRSADGVKLDALKTKFHDGASS